MPFVQAKCPECGGMLAVDDSKKAAICQFCGNAFIVEEAVNNYITYNITNNTTNNVTNQNFGDGAVVNIYEDNSKDFEISGGVLKKYNGSSLTPVIPEGVVAIEGGVFKDSMITEVTLPSTLKEMRYESSFWLSIGPFFNCDYLEKVYLPEGLMNISAGAFHLNKSLKEITIPSTVEIIDSEAFWECENLEKVIFENNPSSARSKSFEWCRKLETVLYRKDGVLVNPLESYETLINSPFSNWSAVKEAFMGTPFYQKYWDIRCNAENRCHNCGSILTKRMFSNEFYCKNCSRGF